MENMDFSSNYTFISFKIYSAICKFNPIGYFYLNDVIDGSIAVKRNLMGFSLAKGLVILLSLSGIIYVIGRKIARKID